MIIIKTDNEPGVDGRLRYSPPQRGAFGLIAGLALWLGGCASESRPPDLQNLQAAGGQNGKSGAPSVDVSRWQAWRDAEAVAAAGPDRFAVIGAGESMQPIYGDRTVLVLQRVNYDSLQPGMQVAYRNRAGRMVVHRLLEKKEGSWLAIGLNNTEPDQERVTEWNLIGVVYASFANDAVR